MKDKELIEQLQFEVKRLTEQLGIAAGLDFQYVEKFGKVKMISWGEDYQNWPIKKRAAYSEALASAYNEACELIQNERNEWRDKALLLEAQGVTAQVAVDNHKMSNVTAITRMNEQNQITSGRIMELEALCKANGIDTKLLYRV